MTSILKQKSLKIAVYILLTILSFIVVYLFSCFLISKNSTHKASKKLHSYQTKSIELSTGQMTYIDAGKGDNVILVAHGINGGYDQGFEALRDQVQNYRIIAPSRFGYPGSPLLADASPTAQVKAYAELLEKLGIKKVYILGTSAGGTIAIRFALDYPQLVNGLILYCSAAPYANKPTKDDYLDYQGPPEPLLSDFMFTVIKPLFPAMMGLPPSAAESSMPLAERLDGIKNDASVTNPDMARNFDHYPIEGIATPTLIFHAKDDKVAPYAAIEKAVPRFRSRTFISFDSGGHMMAGNSERISQELQKFINRPARSD